MTDADFDVRVGIGVQSTADSAVSLQWPEVPVGEELEPVTGRALRDFILEQSRIRGMAKVLSLRSQPGFSFVGQDTAELHALMRSVLCALAVHHSPADLKVMVVTRHPERWSWLVWLPHNQHDDIVDACGPRRLVFASPADLEETLDAELHRKGRGQWAPPIGSSPSTTPSPMDSPAGAGLGPHWVIVDDGTGTPEQWETVTGQKGMAGITMLRLASRSAPASASAARGSGSNSVRDASPTVTGSTPWPTCSPRAPLTGTGGRWHCGRRPMPGS